MRTIPQNALTLILQGVTLVTLCRVKENQMATTSLKLPDSLKERIVKLAADTGKSAHAFMVEAIAEQTERIEEDRAFMARAEASLKHYQETGIAYPAEDVYEYIREKLKGNNPPKLTPKIYK